MPAYVVDGAWGTDVLSAVLFFRYWPDLGGFKIAHQSGILDRSFLYHGA